MKKTIILLFLLITLSFSSEEVTKSTQLELFLFKIGFQSMLSDMNEIKMKSNINTKDLENLSNKMEYLFNELTLNKTNLSEKSNPKYSDIDFDNLQSFILKLETRIGTLEAKLSGNIKENYIEEIPRVKVNDTSRLTSVTAKSSSRNLNIYDKPFTNGKVIDKLKDYSIVSIDYCDKYGWCKINNKSGYVKKYLLKFK